MIEATLTLAVLIPLAGFAGWRVGRSWSDAEMAAELDEKLEQLNDARAFGNHYRKRLKELEAEHPNAEDYRNRAERAEAALAEAVDVASKAHGMVDELIGRVRQMVDAVVSANTAIARAEAENNELRAKLAKYKLPRNAKGQFVRRES